MAAVVYGLAFLPLCALAGMRDVSIGTDTGGYGLFIYQQAVLSKTYDDFMFSLESSIWDIAPLYALGSYVVVKVFQSQFVYFFAIELMILLPVFVAIRHFCNRHFGAVMLFYLLIFFIPGLNMMRQAIAVSLVLLAVIYATERKNTRSVGLLVIAVANHASAVVGVAFFVLWHLIFRWSFSEHEWVFRKRARQISILVVFMSLMGTIFFRDLASMLTSLEGVGRLFLYATHNGSEYGTSTFIFLTLMLVGAFAVKPFVEKKFELRAFFLCMLIASCVPFYILSGIDVTIARMIEYSVIFAVPLIGACLQGLRGDAIRARVGVLLLVGGCLVRFFLCYVVLGFHEAIPYVSSTLGVG